ncbi:acylneuraminate cytidylyltransferase family protein [Alphaproteobacteria bacterium]|nr:acylneuraminate cytidylyltransferase family protein [Alphaproteobacteria bacterium]
MRVYSCFLPCRRNSQRVPRKNVKKFGSGDVCLLSLKLDQLLELELFSEIVVSTDDEKVKEISLRYDSSKVRVVDRDPMLASSTTRLKDLIVHASQVVKNDHVFWTHVTSPFCGSAIYSSAIAAYEQSVQNGKDSLMSVQVLREYVLFEGKALNFDLGNEKWPPTQSLTPIYKVNNAIFINSRVNYMKYEDRVGKRPFLFEMNGLSSLDIDDPEDFDLAAKLYSHHVR